MLRCSFSKELESLQATQALAHSFAELAQVGDVYLLNGPVGAGKSAFARAFILACLDVPEDIPSPTFTLVQTYDTKAFEIWHCDLYRLSSAQEVFELGLDDVFETGVSLIEWPDRLGELSPTSALHIALSGDDDSRQITAHSSDAKWDKLGHLF
ncbi:tRNA (adenosine(37)-N6)-threonylcarbamoyltransferase complex ATPase subunit type 1 TsaE [Algirhabdus cladophorae]|uniref:tRNA (adenosine(37)-N6)-threonylcarbamoyltransferase complex ATPase subunit type 1 TsaE n=1 Tax=Algirhabdus cladophorae TaxID=3377108 RepID=UPI003B848AAC